MVIVISLSPSPASTTSLVPEEIILSSPASPYIRFFPIPPSITSSPSPPMRMSSPAKPVMVSSPPKPSIKSSPGVPSRISGSSPPSRFFIKSRGGTSFTKGISEIAVVTTSSISCPSL